MRSYVFCPVDYLTFILPPLLFIERQHMKITLRKASALQNSINDAIKQIDAKTEITLTEFHDPEAEIARAAAELGANIARRNGLNSALYDIRDCVSAANHTAGVNAKLTQVAAVEKQIQFYSMLATKSERESADVLAGKLRKMAEDKSERRMYGYGDTVNTSVLTKEALASYKARVAELKRDKQKLQDAVLEANVRTEIALSDRTVKTLQDEGLV
jgi:hypothetical protein